MGSVIQTTDSPTRHLMVSPTFNGSEGLDQEVRQLLERAERRLRGHDGTPSRGGEQVVEHVESGGLSLTPKYLGSSTHNVLPAELP